MSRLKAIKLRINSVNNTQQITKAMKMVSASKLRRAQENIERARPYADSLESIVYSLYNSAPTRNNPFFEHRPKGQAMLLVITSDKGLCGAMNANVLKSLNIFINDHIKPNYDDYKFICFGKKGYDYLKRRNYPIDKSFFDLQEKFLSVEMLNFVDQATKDYLNGKFNALYVVHSHFVSLISQAVNIKKVLPIEVSDQEKKDEDQKELSSSEYIYEPQADKILNRLVPLYAENKAMAALFDSIASEHSSRMVAMDAASKNASKLIKKLQLQYNRARQAVITKELIEIISGAEVASA